MRIDLLPTGERCPDCEAEIVLATQEGTDEIVLACECAALAALA